MSIIIIIHCIFFNEKSKRIYLGTTVDHAGQSITQVTNRINQAKSAFWKKATITRSNIGMATRIRVMMCYVFFVVQYECETWTYSKFKSDIPQNQRFLNVVLQKNVEN